MQLFLFLADTSTVPGSNTPPKIKYDDQLEQQNGCLSQQDSSE